MDLPSRSHVLRRGEGEGAGGAYVRHFVTETGQNFEKENQIRKEEIGLSLKFPVAHK